MINTQETLRQIQTVITDMTQWPTYYEGGAQQGAHVVLEKDADPQNIRSLFVQYEKAQRTDVRLAAILGVFWQVLGVADLSLAQFLHTADREKTGTRFPVYRRELQRMRISLLDYGSTETIRVDYIN